MLDSDPDFEDDGDGTGQEHGPYPGDHEDDEPTLGASEAIGGGITDWSWNVGAAFDECEETSEDEGAQCDDEGGGDQL